jgi:uncharacterized membrane protein YhaH (DUF805 family)
MKLCPFCGEEILAAAKKCKHCGKWLDKPTASQGENDTNPVMKSVTACNQTKDEQNTHKKSLWEWNLKCWKQYADFEGRARRKEFWSFYLFYFGGYMLSVAVGGIIGGIFNDVYLGMNIFSGHYLLVTLIPAIAVLFRRLHDIGLSGWWLLIILIRAIFLLFVVASGAAVWLLINFIQLYCEAAIILFVFTLLNGQSKTNKWGTNPKHCGEWLDKPTVSQGDSNTNPVMKSVTAYNQTKDEQNTHKKSLWEWNLKCWKQYADFEGRARRKEFWSFYLFYSLGIILCLVVGAIIGGIFNEADFGMNIAFGIFLIATLFPGTAVLVRRLHDTERSGWWLVIILMPVLLNIYVEATDWWLFIPCCIETIVLFIFTLLNSQKKTNKWGANTKHCIE